MNNAGLSPQIVEARRLAVRREVRAPLADPPPMPRAMPLMIARPPADCLRAYLPPARVLIATEPALAAAYSERQIATRLFALSRRLQFIGRLR